LIPLWLWHTDRRSALRRALRHLVVSPWRSAAFSGALRRVLGGDYTTARRSRWSFRRLTESLDGAVSCCIHQGEFHQTDAASAIRRCSRSNSLQRRPFRGPRLGRSATESPTRALSVALPPPNPGPVYRYPHHGVLGTLLASACARMKRSRLRKQTGVGGGFGSR